MEWREMNEVMVSQMDADDKSGQIMLGILYLVIAFGVFGTVLMLTAERKTGVRSTGGHRDAEEKTVIYHDP